MQPSTDPSLITTTSRRTWVVVFLIVMLMICLTVFESCKRTATASIEVAKIAANAITNAFKTEVNITTIVNSAVSDAQQRAKLIVLTQRIGVTITNKSEKNQNLFGYKLPLGTTMVTLRVPDNKVQYVVDLSHFSSNSFEYDDPHKTLIVKIPTPKADEDLVEVQTDPERIEYREEIGWARLSSRSGVFLREQAMRELRPNILKSAEAADYIEHAKSSATNVLQSLLQPITQSLKPGIDLTIAFD